jgi:hypothetical protein
MKNLFTVFILMFVVNIALAKVIQPNEQALDEDLNFTLEESEEQKRVIASQLDEGAKPAQKEELKDTRQKVQFWEY